MDGKETVLCYGMCSNCGVSVGKGFSDDRRLKATPFYQNVPCVFLKRSLFFKPGSSGFWVKRVVWANFSSILTIPVIYWKRSG